MPTPTSAPTSPTTPQRIRATAGKATAPTQTSAGFSPSRRSSSFLAFFGVGGLSALESKLHPAVAVFIGTASGVVAVSLLGYVLRALRKLNSDGTVRISGSIGLEGTVYLRIPAEGNGSGKITLSIQGRTIEVLARTPGPELRAGERVVVSRVIDEQTVEVVTQQSWVVKPTALAE